MEAFGKSRQKYLAKFLELPNGIPDSDSFRRLFERINSSELSSCLVNLITVERTKRGTVIMLDYLLDFDSLLQIVIKN